MDFAIKFNQLTREEKLQLYIYHMTPRLNKQALFSDGTREYRFPEEPSCNESVKLRFRTERDNVDLVYLYLDGKKITMRRGECDTLFDYYETTISLTDKKVTYYFEIHSSRTIVYYNKIGVTNERNETYDFAIMPGFQTPNWAKGAVIYQIFVDRFYNGDKTNDVVDREYCYIGASATKAESWNTYPKTMDVRQFYGGDLCGVIKKMDYLKDLGIEAIYFNPIFVSPSNHKYDIQDYDYVDPHYGTIKIDKGNILEEGDMNNEHATKYISRVTSKENLEASNELFIELVKEAHKRGIRVILDGVFNHCGSFNKWLDKECIYEHEEGYEKGAYVDEDSPYRTFFKFREKNWPYNNDYDGWWGHDTLPKLNYEESPKLYKYIMEIGKKWVSPPFNADGWRLDVAADLGHSNEYNHKFWREFRNYVKEANPEAIILAEHYGDPSSWLQGDEWDTVMNYDAFMEPITWFLTGMEKHSDEFNGDLLGNSDHFWGAMNHHMSKFNTQSLQVSMNELSNHDHSRFLTRTNRKVGRIATLGSEAANEGINKGIFREAVVMQMTWIGAPTIYYGDEAGLCGWTDPDNRRTYPWGKEDKELIQLHKDLIQIHKSYEVFKTGSILFLEGKAKYIAYGRFNKIDKAVIAVNNSFEEIFVHIPVWALGVTDNMRLVRLIQTTEDGYSLEAVIYEVVNGMLKLILPPISATLIKNIRFL